MAKAKPDEVWEIELRLELCVLVGMLAEALIGKRRLPEGTRYAAYRAGQIVSTMERREQDRLDAAQREAEAKQRRAKRRGHAA
jgi:hypothetical protein